MGSAQAVRGCGKTSQCCHPERSEGPFHFAGARKERTTGALRPRNGRRMTVPRVFQQPLRSADFVLFERRSIVAVRRAPLQNAEVSRQNPPRWKCRSAEAGTALPQSIRRDAVERTVNLASLCHSDPQGRPPDHWPGPQTSSPRRKARRPLPPASSASPGFPKATYR